MKKIEMFEADDGSIHKIQSDALNRDDLYKLTRNLSKLLGGDQPSIEFSNGQGYFQITPSKLTEFDYQFEQAVRKYESWITNEFDVKNIKFSPISGYIGRCLSDSNSLLYQLFSLRICIDSQNRRWGQPYFAFNPNEGKPIKLGDF